MILDKCWKTSPRQWGQNVSDKRKHMRSVPPISRPRLTLNQGRLPSFLCLTRSRKTKKRKGKADAEAVADLDANEREILIDETWTDIPCAGCIEGPFVPLFHLIVSCCSFAKRLPCLIVLINESTCNVSLKVKWISFFLRVIETRRLVVQLTG